MLDTIFTRGRIQLQIECVQSTNSHQCCICHKSFQMKDASVIACNNQGDRYGEICTECIAKGSSWLTNRILQQHQLQLS